jgi:hypothetical protein
MLDLVWSALVDTFYSVPPVRFVMGMVSPQWRPFWAALWLATIGYVVVRTVNLLEVRHARLKIMREVLRMEGPSEPSTSRTSRSSTPPPGPPPPASEPLPPKSSGGAIARIPPAVLAVSLVVAGVVALMVGYFMIDRRGAPAAGSLSDTAGVNTDSGRTADTTFAFKLRGSRMENDDCVMTFEVTGGTGDAREITVHVMDASDVVISRDTRSVPSLTRGLFLDFQFRNAECDAIQSWQFQGQ